MKLFAVKEITQKNSLSFLVFFVSVSYAFFGIIISRYQRFLDIDESGYAYMAFNNWNAFHRGGFVQLALSILSQPLHAPIQPALSSIMFAITGPKILSLFIIPSISLSLILVICFKISTHYLDVNRSLFTTFSILSIPILLKFSHTYIFATITTLSILYCYYTIIYKFQINRKFHIYVGFILALVPLTRTVSIIFVPSLIFLLIVQNFRLFKIYSINRILQNISLTLFATLSLISPWLYFNFNAVSTYFRLFGYGSFSNDYGNKSSIFVLNTWFNDLFALFRYDLSLIFVSTFSFLIIFLIFKLIKKDLVVSNKLTDKINIKFGFLQFLLLYVIPISILNSTSNQGYGFRLIYYVAFFLWVTIFVVKFLPKIFLKASWLILVISLILNIVPKQLIDSFNLQSQINVKNELLINIYTKNELINDYLKGGLNSDFFASKPNSNWYLNTREGFDSFNIAHVEVLRFLESKNLDSQNLLLAFRHRLFNPNSLNLIRAKEGQSLIPISFLPVNSSSPLTSVDLMDFGLTNYCLVAISEGNVNEILPESNQETILNILINSYYLQIYNSQLPDGRTILIFKKPRC